MLEVNQTTNLTINIAGIPGLPAPSGRPATIGNICRMRIVIDKSLIELFDKNKEKLKSLVKYLEMALNDIYKAGGVKVKVEGRKEQLQFKVVELLFHDEAYCRRENHSPG